MATNATYDVHLDLDGDELFDASNENIEANVRSEPGVTFTRGRDFKRPLSAMQIGTAHLELANDSLHGNGIYSPGGAAEPAKGMRLRVRATDPTTSTRYNLFTGFIQKPIQHPASAERMVEVDAEDVLSIVKNARGVRTALLEGQTTDVCIAALLDAVGFPKNAQPYVTSLTPAGQWGLGESSGNALDISGNGNHGTVTIGAGSRDYAALDDAGDGAINFDGVITGAGTIVTVADVAALRNPFDGGGAVIALFNYANGANIGSAAIVDKTTGTWTVRIASPNGNGVSPYQLELTVNFSGATGTWKTTSSVITGNTNYAAMVLYNAGATTNDPTIYLVNLDAGTLQTLTVGSGLTETSTPVGARNDDTGGGLIIGNRTGAGRTWKGPIDEVAIFKGAQPTLAQFKRFVARSIAAVRRLDVGKSTLAYWWLDETMDPWTELEALRNTEGPGADVYADGGGACVFKNRHALATEARSTTSNVHFRGATTEPIHSEPFEYDDGQDNVINVATLTVNRRTPAASAVVWSFGASITLAAGETRTFVAQEDNLTPFKTAIAPASGTDYNVSSGSLASVPTISATSGAQVTITVIAGAAGAVLDGLALRAVLVPVTEVNTVTTTLDTSASIALYGRNAWDFNRNPIRAEFAASVAQDWVNAVPLWWGYGRASAMLTLYANRGTAAMTAALGRTLGDRVAVTANDVALAGDEFWIDYVEHLIHEGELLHVARFGLGAAGGAEYFTLDESELDGSDGLGW